MITDRYELYERTVQAPESVVALLRELHGGEARVLGEDFSGTAAVSRAWVRLVRDGRAIAVDIDASVLERAAGAPGLELVCGDVRDATDPRLHGADVIFAGNFSIGELGERADLVRYFARSRQRLRPGGILVCDTYGGPSAHRTGAIERSHFTGSGERIRYVWEQREVDLETGRVVNAMHFRIERDGEVVASIEDAFVYRWRLWSVPELREAMIEAGFDSTEVRQDLWPGESIRASLETGEGFIACVVARALTGR